MLISTCSHTLSSMSISRNLYMGKLLHFSFLVFCQMLQSGHLILLLVSAEFRASDVCYSQEMRAAMQRHEARKARVFPILVRPADWQGAPFAKLAVLPSNRQPVSQWSNRDEPWLEI